MKRVWWLLAAGLVLFVRFYRLAEVPVHLGNDEISIAYDAYSVGLTLRDEHNDFLPLAFKSHGVHKAPLYIYLAVLPVEILGNTEFAVRSVSAVAGLLTVVVLGLVAGRLTGRKEVGFWTAVVLAFAPIHIYSSRIALESNLALFFLVLGIYLFFRADDSGKKSLVLFSGVSFSLSIYAYHLEWMLTPLLIAALLVLFRDRKKRFRSGLLLAAVFVFCLPLFLDYLSGAGKVSGASGKMVWGDPAVRSYLGGSNPLILKAALILRAFLSNLSSCTNLGRLFFNGLALLPQDSPYLFGYLLPISLPFFLIGLVQGKRYLKENSRFGYFWLISGLLTVSLTRGGLNLYRWLANVAPYCLFIAIGLVSAWQRLGFSFKIAVVFGHLLFLAYFLVFYFNHFPVHSGESWQYGYKQIASLVKELYPQYKKIVVDPRFGPDNRYSGLPHLYIPYFTGLDPNALLKRVGRDGLCFDKYIIRDIDWQYEVDKVESGSLYILPEANLPPKEDDRFRLRETVYLPNGKPAFRIFEVIP